MSDDLYAGNRTVFHKSSRPTIIGQGAVEWMRCNRSTRTRKKLKQTFSA